MADREKTIKRLEHLSEWLFHLYQVVCDGDAPDYYDAYKTVDDAIDLLKNQEAKPPIVHTVLGVNYYYCPGCARPIIKSVADGHPRYCQDCGKGLIWDVT